MKMTQVQTSLRVQGIYALLIGLLMVAAPALLLGPLEVPTDCLWVRLVGLLAIALAFYYFAAVGAGKEGLWFARASLFGRAVAVVGLVVLAAVFDYPRLVLVVLFEAVLTVWTWRALR